MNFLRLAVASIGVVVCLTAFLLFTLNNAVTFVLVVVTLAVVWYVVIARPEKRARDRTQGR